MKRRDAAFAVALLLSLLLHGAAALLWSGLAGTQPRVRPARVILDAVLVSPAQQAPAQPPLFLPEPPRPPPRPAAASQPPPPSARAGAPRRAASPDEEAIRQASGQIARSLLYPPEAITRGLEGEALVLLFLDDAGNVVAARVERGSGHAILDEAAVRAAKSVRSLPGGAAREVLLPVRFRLR